MHKIIYIYNIVQLNCRHESGLPPTYISTRQAKEVLDAGWNIALLQKILGKCDIIESWNKIIDSAINIAIHCKYHIL
jgi:hypothetical protein